MNAVVPAYQYQVANHDAPHCLQTIQFVQKVEGVDGKLKTAIDGTTNEEVISALVDRMKVLDASLPHACNKRVIQSLNGALKQLTARTLDRQARLVKGTSKP